MSANEESLGRWIGAWDERIAAWVRAMDEGIDPAACDLGLAAVRDPWLAANRQIAADEVYRALPEPYAGDPLAEGLQGVGIYHNPGGALAVQLHPRGPLVQSIREGTPFSALARHWQLAQATTQWWLRTAEWFARVCGAPLSRRTPAILGLDLVPWHSTERGPLEPGAALGEHLRRELLLPAREAAARALFRTAAGEPLVLASHEWVNGVLRGIGARRLATVDEASWDESVAPWPRSFRGLPTQRTFERLVIDLPGGDLHLLTTWAPGSNFPPGKNFDPMIRWLCGEAA
ncbi:hypothetical protein [Vulgatibacter sp.]|uniref:hypothetical protein n=1 Tax=Vulgatibacter sp. TaxID=1971226 RepID=UPI0035688EB2